MRKSQQDPAELRRIEEEDDARRARRKTGLTMGKIRDRGWAHLFRGAAKVRGHSQTNDIRFHWDLDADNPNLFWIEIPGGLDRPKVNLYLDAEEVRKWLRWV